MQKPPYERLKQQVLKRYGKALELRGRVGRLSATCLENPMTRCKVFLRNTSNLLRCQLPECPGDASYTEEARGEVGQGKILLNIPPTCRARHALRTGAVPDDPVEVVVLAETATAGFLRQAHAQRTVTRARYPISPRRTTAS